jgi:hypothetical protein
MIVDFLTFAPITREGLAALKGATSNRIGMRELAKSRNKFERSKSERHGERAEITRFASDHDLSQVQIGRSSFREEGEIACRST